MLLVPSAGGPPFIVKDYAACSALVRACVAPFLVGHELAMLERVRGLPGVPAPRGRVDRLALALEYIEGVPLRRKSHRSALPRAFFDALEGILEGLSLRGMAYFDLRSPSNILWTRATGAPALVDLAAALPLPLPRSWTRALERSALDKLRARFERPEGAAVPEPEPLDYQELHLGRARVCFLDRGRLEDPVPALFLHDVGHSSEIFRPTLENARLRARRGIGLDLPGFGRSSLCLRRLSPRRVATHVACFVDALRLDRIDLVGVGWGGLVARELAVRRPERVRALITLDTPLAEVPPALRKRMQEARRQPEVLRRRLLRELPAGVSQEQRAELERTIQRTPARALRRAYAGIQLRRMERQRFQVAAPLPNQPWLAVRSDLGEGTDRGPGDEAGSLRSERWSEPLANAERFWDALERLA